MTTAWSVPEDLAATAEVRTRQSGMAAGLPAVAEVFAQVDPEIEIEASVADGASLTDGGVLLRLSGPARSLITGTPTRASRASRAITGDAPISARTRPLPHTGSGCPRPAPSPGACGGTAAL
ncbi:hypothetical protein OG346_37435 [Streptomyces sp. NBC_01530]